jgi:hypothetical protein
MGNPAVAGPGRVRGLLSERVLRRRRLTPAVEGRVGVSRDGSGAQTWPGDVSAMRFRTTRTSSGDLPNPVVGLLGVLLGLALLAFWFDQRANVSLASRADPLMVVIRHEGDQVMFEAHENVGRLRSTPGVPRSVSRLLVTTRGDALWQVETVTPHAGPIIYGRVPEGFVQMIPAIGPPPALRADDECDVSVSGPGGTGRARFTLHTPAHSTR